MIFAPKFNSLSKSAIKPLMVSNADLSEFHNIFKQEISNLGIDYKFRFISEPYADGDLYHDQDEYQIYHLEESDYISTIGMTRKDFITKVKNERHQNFLNFAKKYKVDISELCPLYIIAKFNIRGESYNFNILELASDEFVFFKDNRINDILNRMAKFLVNINNKNLL